MFFMTLCALILMDVKKMNINLISSKKLAYLGDAVYELMIRTYLIKERTNDLNKLQEMKIKYVSARNQALMLDYLIENDLIMQEEIRFIKKARNLKVSSKPKNTDVITYKKATAIEALFGKLYLENNLKRIEELTNLIIKKGD